MLDANKIEQMRNYRKSFFPKNVSTTFAAHCCPSLNTSCFKNHSDLRLQQGLKDIIDIRLHLDCSIIDIWQKVLGFKVLVILLICN